MLCIEETYLIEIPRNIVEETFKLSSKNADLKERVDFLSSVSIFAGIPKIYLVPLAGNIDIRKYTHGEYIIK